MPPSSKRSQRKRRETTSDMAAPPTEEETTPTRPAKRRRKLPEPEQPDTELPPSGGDDALVSQITQNLKSHPVQASKDHANSIHEANGDGVQAFAKVAAQDWTFYITKLAINIGRAPEGGAPPDGSSSARRSDRRRDGDRALSEDAVDPDQDPEQVHIDLGPSKTVSREHATISYDSKDERWLLTVRGRNGVRVDNKPLKAGESHRLSSGEVMEIGSVEMMFVLPSELSPLHIDPSFLERSGLDATTPQSRRPLRQKAQLSSSRPSDADRPGTPPPPSTQSRSGLDSIKSPAFSTPGPVMVGANGADLSKDENKHIKPQYSYAQMITQAITSVPDDKLTLNGIYTYITDNYAYYRNQVPSGWQNSIRHNLSLNKSFEKVARSTYEPGKGAKWQIVPDVREELISNAWRIGRGGHRGSSAPSSPNHLNYITQGPGDLAARGSPSSRKRGSSVLSPPAPRSALPMSQSTPDGGALRHSSRANAVLTADGSPLPRSKKTTTTDPSFSSFNPQSPTLTSSYLQDEGGSFITPAPPRVNPRLAPPSTAQRPSQHMPTSSPAPFWRFVDIGSTPLRPVGGADLGTSPSKPAVTLPPESSSPVRGGNKSLPSSPTRPQQSQTESPQAQPDAPKEEEEDDDEVQDETRPEPEEDEKKQEEKRTEQQPPPPPPPPPPQDEDDDDDDEQGFDLAKGFQSIGAYHEPAGRGLSVGNAFSH